MPSNVVWIAPDVVAAIHEAQIAEHGGALGVRDPSLLEAALARPRNMLLYADADVATIGAYYALGIIKNHPFVDGNKRVGAVLLELFLSINARELVADDAELLAAILAIAASEISEEQFVDWVRRKTLIAA